MLAEAVGLVNTLDNWTVVDTMILSTKTPEKKKIFGKGNFQALTGIVSCCNSLAFFKSAAFELFLLSPISEKIRQTAGITAVFVNVERLSAVSQASFRVIFPLAPDRKRLYTNSHQQSCIYICTEGAEGSLGGQRF